jgi:hypothetical protein
MDCGFRCVLFFITDVHLLLVIVYGIRRIASKARYSGIHAADCGLNYVICLGCTCFGLAFTLCLYMKWRDLIAYVVLVCCSW